MGRKEVDRISKATDLFARVALGLSMRMFVLSPARFLLLAPAG